MVWQPYHQNMIKTKSIEDIKLTDFPQEVDNQNSVRIYDETSYENMIAVLSQYLHNGESGSKEDRKEIIAASLDFLERKKSIHPDLDYEPTVEYASMVAEDPAQYGLFEEFFNVPYPNPKQGRFTFIDLFAGIGGIRLPFNELGYRCVFSSGINLLNKLILPILVKCLLVTLQKNRQKHIFQNISICCWQDSLVRHFQSWVR